MGTCSRWAIRGYWGRRVSKDESRNLGGPMLWWMSATNAEGVKVQYGGGKTPKGGE